MTRQKMTEGGLCRATGSNTTTQQHKKQQHKKQQEASTQPSNTTTTVCRHMQSDNMNLCVPMKDAFMS